MKWFLLLAALTGGVVAVSRYHGESRPLAAVADALRRALAPRAEKSGGFAAGAEGLSRRLFEMRSAQSDNLALRRENAELHNELLRLRERNRALEAEGRLFAESGTAKGEGRPARVIGYDPAALYRSITIDRGAADGIAPDQPVVSGGAIVGRVLRTGERSSQVLLVTDLNSAVDVLDARTRARGLLVGKRRELALKRERWLTQAEYVSASEEIRSGDLLLSSGLDGVFPKGLPVGVVGEVKKDATGLFWQAEVEPYAELNKLEEVLVLVNGEDNQG
jgi:rod shape-determining protein MreC